MSHGKVSAVQDAITRSQKRRNANANVMVNITVLDTPTQSHNNYLKASEQRAILLFRSLTLIPFFWGVILENIVKKREHYVNLYRLVHDSNEGLGSRQIAAMSEEELDQQIATLSVRAREMGRKI